MLATRLTTDHAIHTSTWICFGASVLPQCHIVLGIVQYSSHFKCNLEFSWVNSQFYPLSAPNTYLAFWQYLEFCLCDSTASIWSIFQYFGLAFSECIRFKVCQIIMLLLEMTAFRKCSIQFTSSGNTYICQFLTWPW